NTGLFWAATDALAVATGGVEAMRLDASQRVGIGVTPMQRLHVRQDQNATTRTRLENASTGAAAVAQVDAQADQARGVLRAMGSNHSTRPNRVEIGSETNHSVAFIVNDTLRALWNSIGLGIGTTPVTSGANATLLQVGDPLASGGAGITLGATTTNDIAFSDATSGAGQYAGLIRYSHADDSFRIWTNSTEKLRLTATGTLHVGNFVSSTFMSAYPIVEPTAAVYHNFYGHNIAPATCTTALVGVSHTANTAAAAFTLPDLYSFRAYQGTVGAGSTLTRAAGFAVFSDYSKAGTNIAFRCEIPAAANNYALYSTSGVQSYLEGNLGLGTGAPTRKLDINADSFRVRTGKTPASAGAAGVQGEICWDASFIYVCVATNTWRRVAHATW
ncbi:MAG TPA: hypothetical protein PLZ93_25425, partial [Nocardioides sp.]|nr:hypothetical protein [Nocardioides sp.]